MIRTAVRNLGTLAAVFTLSLVAFAGSAGDVSKAAEHFKKSFEVEQGGDAYKEHLTKVRTLLKSGLSGAGKDELAAARKAAESVDGGTRRGLFCYFVASALHQDGNQAAALEFIDKAIKEDPRSKYSEKKAEIEKGE